jgi:WD40 repeat protein
MLCILKGVGNVQSEFANDPQLTSLYDDARLFVELLAEPIRLSVDHVYISALPFTPTTSALYQQYGRETDGPSICVLHGCTRRWKSLRVEENPFSFDISLKNHEDAVTDREDEIIDHEEAVTDIAFSRDGLLIISGSCDKTVRIWDATTGEAACPPLQGHTDGVTCVAFSPDGRIVSGSLDKTVRIWDVQASHPAACRVLKGHRYDTIRRDLLRRARCVVLQRRPYSRLGHK